MKCYHCKRDLNESEFSPSRRKLKSPICKDCEAKKEERYRNERILNDEADKNFDMIYGGYSIFILNRPNKKEYKYTIQSTDGFFFQTNDVFSFQEQLKDIII